ncbi:MAG: ABC transporter ATP-binding protein [Geminicoccaceae bacterium]
MSITLDKAAGDVTTHEHVPAGLQVSGLTHAFGERTVVRDVSFSVPHGGVHSLLGPSGCGKTTTLRLIAGLETVQHGQIRIDDAMVAGDVFCIPPENRQVGLMFQDFALFPHLRVEDNIGFGLRRLPAAERARRVRELLDRVGLSDRARDYPRTLSGGEQQRVALARALAPSPRLMLLDEPFSALDAHLREQLRDEVMGILRREGTPTLMVTHDADEALRLSDRVHVMQHGRIVQSDNPAGLFANPANAFVAGFFGPINRFKSWVVEGAVDTPLGKLPAANIAHGRAVDVVIRPEALRPCANAKSGDVSVRVGAIRDMGMVRLLDLELPGGVPLIAREYGAAACCAHPGATVGVELDRRHCFVFEASQ